MTLRWRVSEAGEGERRQHRVDRRGLEEVADALAAIGEVVDRHRLRRPVEGLDRLIVERDERHRRVQEGAAADLPAVGAGLRAQQQRRRVDGAARQHDPAPGVDDQASARAVGGPIEHVGDDGARAAPVGLDQLGPAVAVEVGAGGDGVGQEGRARRELGVERAPHAAVAEPGAPFDAAVDELRLPPQLGGSVVQLAVVVVDVVRVAGADVQPPLDLGEVRRQRGRVEIAHAVPGRPEGQRPLGRPERRRPVDGRPAAHRSPLQDQDRQIVGRPVAVLLIERRVGPRLLHVEVAPGVVAPFFDDHHPRAGGGQDGGGRAPAGAAADDDVVGLDRRRIGELGAGDDAAGATGRSSRSSRSTHGVTSGGCGTDGGPG